MSSSKSPLPSQQEAGIWFDNVFPGRRSVQYEQIELGEQSTPRFNIANSTKRFCEFGLLLSTLVGIAAIVAGCLSKGGKQTWKIGAVPKELILLGINVLLLAVTESLGFIHATSLRWALFNENRLEFNANLRLLTFSQRSLPNGTFWSIVFFICTTICYTAGNMLLVFNASSWYIQTVWAGYDITLDFDPYKDLVSLTRSVPICLGIAILVQCLICCWCLKEAKFPSWSSDPLNTIEIARYAGLKRQEGRAMMSVHDRRLSDGPSRPIAKQRSSRQVSKSVRWILFLVTAVLVGLVIWTVVIIYVGYHYRMGGSWSFFPTNTPDYEIAYGPGWTYKNDKSQTLTVFLFFFANWASEETLMLTEWRVLSVLLFKLVIQSALTIGLHCTELQCQLSRDEAIWRTLSSPKGRMPNTTYNSLTQPFKSWQSLGLLIFKPAIHWLFGAALQVDYGLGLVMRVPQTAYMTAGWFLFLLFVAAVTLHRPKGYLPASYGHLQTMVNVADIWSEKMYWGDKGTHEDENRVWHAGTSPEPLPNVSPDKVYA